MFLVGLSATSHAALVIADTATELALGQARQMPDGRPAGVEALPDVLDLVADHADLLGPGTEEALSRELSRVWINQKIEVYIRTVDRDAITGYEPNALKIIRGRSGHCLVLVFTDTPATYLYVMSDSLSRALGLDGVRRTVQNAFEIANNKRPADARIIATVVALLQHIVKEGAVTATPQQTAATAGPAAGPTQDQMPRPDATATAHHRTDPQSLPSDAPSQFSESAQSGPPTKPDSDSAPPETSAAPTESILPAPDTPSQKIPDPGISEPQPTEAVDASSTPEDSKPASPASAPPLQLLLAGGVAVVLLLALFTFQKLRARARGQKLSLNAPPTPRAPRAEQKPLEFKGTLKRGLPEKKPVVRQQPSPSEVEGSSSQPMQPLAAAEKAFPHATTQSGVKEQRLETIRIRKDYPDPPTSMPEVPTPIVAEQARHSSGGETAIQATDMPSVAELEKTTPTRTPLLRKMGMEPDQQDATSTDSHEQNVREQIPSEKDAASLATKGEALLERIEAYVIKMRRASPAQRPEMLRGLEILLLAYRETVGEPHPAERQLEIQLQS